jgi:hypothetical protein
LLLRFVVRIASNLSRPRSMPSRDDDGGGGGGGGGGDDEDE